MFKVFRKIKNFFKRYSRYKKEKKYFYRLKGGEKLKINIIADKESGWICYKFGQMVYENLKKLGYDASLTNKYDSSADINHYFTPNEVGIDKESKIDKNTTFMITHVDTTYKKDQILKLTKSGATGICMSLETRNRMLAAGVPANKICYINPAQDGQIMPKKISLGFTHRVYDDNRKRESMLIDICKEINPAIFKFVIMGSGWDAIINEIKSMGFEVDYYSEFDKKKYNELIINLDYYCYFGTDEGSMGYLDAVAAGIGTIVTPQGYHLDTALPITYPVNTVDDIVNVLKEISKKKEQSLKFIQSWTWENYTLKHLEIWEYIVGAKPLSELLSNRGNYIDGIFSLMLDDLTNYQPFKDIIKERLKGK